MGGSRRLETVAAGTQSNVTCTGAGTHYFIFLSADNGLFGLRIVQTAGSLMRATPKSHATKLMLVAPVEAPRASARPVTARWHGVTLTDEFAWLRDPNWQAVMRDPTLLDPAIRSHLERENAYADAMLAATQPLQEALFAEMKGRIQPDDAGVPTPDGQYSYFTRYRDGGQYPLVCREPRDGSTAETLIDGDAIAAGKAFFRFGGTAHSHDHKLLAWSMDDTGAELFTIRVRDLAAMADLADEVPETSGAVVWMSDRSAFYYVHVDEQHRPSSVHRHRLGTPASEDVEIFPAPGGGYFVSLGELQSRRFAEISVHDHETTECWLIDLADPDARPRARRTARAVDAVLCRASSELPWRRRPHHPHQRRRRRGFQDRLGAARRSGRAQWQDLVPHRPGVYIASFMVLADWLIVLEREDGLPRIVVRRLATGEEHTIAFDEEAYWLGLEGGYEFATDTLRFSYSSMTTPEEIWDYDLATRSRVPAQAPADSERPQSLGLRDAAAVGAGGRRGNRAGVAPLSPHDAARRHRAGARLRLRRLRLRDLARVRGEPAVARRSRLRLRDRPCARRHGEGLALVSRGQAREQAEHVHRFHRRDRISGRAEDRRARQDRGAGRSAGGMLIGAVPMSVRISTPR